MRVKPWSKECENIIKQMKKDFGKASTFNRELSQEFGRKTNLINKGFLDVASTRYNKKKNKTLFQLGNDIEIIELPNCFDFRRKKFL